MDGNLGNVVDKIAQAFEYRDKEKREYRNQLVEVLQNFENELMKLRDKITELESTIIDMTLTGVDQKCRTKER